MIHPEKIHDHPHYRARIEEAFGREWLRDSRNNAGHPIFDSWHEATKAMRIVRKRPRSHLQHKCLLLNEEVSEVLDHTVALENFESTILPDLKNKGTYRSAFYTAKTAARHRRVGHTVRFVPQSKVQGVKIADLRVENGREFAWIECKWREKIDVTDATHVQKTSWRDDAFRSANEGLRKSVDYTVFSFSPPSRDAYEQAARWARELIDEGRMGVVRSYSDSMMAYIVENNLDSLQIINPESLTAWRAAGRSLPYLQYAASDVGGRRRLTHLTTANIICVDGDRFSSLKQEIQETRGKWPKSERGILYIDVAREWDSIQGSMSYLELLTWFIRDWVWRVMDGAMVNTRIKALVLTGDCPPVRSLHPLGFYFNRISANYCQTYLPTVPPRRRPATADNLLNTVLDLPTG